MQARSTSTRVELIVAILQHPLHIFNFGFNERMDCILEKMGEQNLLRRGGRPHPVQLA